MVTGVGLWTDRQTDISPRLKALPSHNFVVGDQMVAQRVSSFPAQFNNNLLTLPQPPTHTPSQNYQNIKMFIFRKKINKNSIIQLLLLGLRMSWQHWQDGSRRFEPVLCLATAGGSFSAVKLILKADVARKWCP